MPFIKNAQIIEKKTDKMMQFLTSSHLDKMEETNAIQNHDFFPLILL